MRSGASCRCLSAEELRWSRHIALDQAGALRTGPEAPERMYRKNEHDSKLLIAGLHNKQELKFNPAIHSPSFITHHRHRAFPPARKRDKACSRQLALTFAWPSTEAMQ